MAGAKSVMEKTEGDIVPPSPEMEKIEMEEDGGED
jgi:hypothetical protein